MATALRTRRPARGERGIAAPTIVRAHTAEAVAALEPRFAHLDACPRDPASQFSWIHAALAAFPDDDAPRLVAIEQAGQLRAVAPLVARSVGGVRRFCFSASMLGMPANFGASDSKALAQLTRAIVAVGTPLWLDRLPADGEALAALRKAGRGRVLTTVHPAEPFAELALNESWARPEEHLSDGRRRDLQRAQRRAEQIGPVVAEIHAPDLDQLPALLDRVFEVEAAASKPHREPETHRLQRVVFLRRYAQAACIEGTLRVSLLRIGSRAAAAQLAVELGGTHWVLVMHEDKRLAECLPAQLLTRETLRCAAESLLDTYAFWGCAPSHARVWPVTKRNCVSLKTYPLGARGLAAFAADTAGNQRPRIERAGSQLWRGTKKLAARCAWPLERVARVYVAGTKLEHALRAADKLADSNLRSTIAYWDARHEPPRRIADVYLAALRSLSGRRQAWLAVKASSLNFSRELVGELVEEARARNVGLQFDANVLEAAQPTRDLLAGFLASGARLGWTLPGCWKRSVDDAAWAAAGGISVRVVKAPWPDPADPKADRHEGFLGLIDALAGAAPRVIVGTHDLALVDEAVRRLRTAGSDCQLEVLYGWPMRRSLEQAQRLGLSVSVCVPFGKSYLPHALSQLRTDPRHAWWLMRGSRAETRSAE